ncbi:ferritin-like domain-containing protein [Pradoshia sp. D12]|uniref:ferritin-like domain-containing protein n=1 Tax=Bacillaceae TaxID=186817 RepID=UPI00098214F4|nr:MULTISPECIES: ferritin-like domain-containing protein [Bacillaceae]QFK72044.1 ferritin-like domain-containing protein [Pradoshia sp. D12]TPF71464.1 ferritin-like domain-containing protein [Bacillus sp. D12]
MDQKQAIKTLNTFLRGSYMAINAYEHFIKKLQHSSLKDSFISIQKDLKNHAILISERIQNLGGTPITSEGIFGRIEAKVVNLIENYNSEEEIIKHAIKGENIYGIKMSEDLVRGKLDEESLSLVHKILDKDREHVDYLKSLLHS